MIPIVSLLGATKFIAVFRDGSVGAYEIKPEWDQDGQWKGDILTTIRVSYCLAPATLYEIRGSYLHEIECYAIPKDGEKVMVQTLGGWKRAISAGEVFEGKLLCYRSGDEWTSYGETVGWKSWRMPGGGDSI